MAAVAVPWLPKAAAPALALHPDAFELAMRPLSDTPVTLAPYTGTAMVWSDGQWFIVDFDAPHATSDRRS